MIGEDDSLNGTPSRVVTPAPALAEKDGAAATPAEEDGTIQSTEQKESRETEANTAEKSPPATPAPLPNDVRQKLRKLERLEPKYSGRSVNSHQNLFFY